MTQPHRVYVGTVGNGLWRSIDGGDTFRRASDGMFVECHVRALIVDSRDPRVLFLGSESGLYRSGDGADNWSRVESPLNDLQLWALLQLPGHPEVMLAGSCPSRFFLSRDGGRSWTEPQAQIVKDCPRIMHTRVTSFAAAADDPETLWAGVEIDGLHRSTDGGRSWHKVGSGLSSQDIHGLAVVPGARRRLLASTNNDLNVSEDDGTTWEPLKVGRSLPWSYCRGLAQKCGQPEVVFMGNGDGPPGSEGAVARSTDGGKSWQTATMPGRSNSTLWNFAVHPADPELIYAGSVSGEVYRSTDAGASWLKLAREFGEIRALAWAPV